jgi:hypothetical protein
MKSTSFKKQIDLELVNHMKKRKHFMTRKFQSENFIEKSDKSEFAVFNLFLFKSFTATSYAI